jgi:hypothetical protein
MVYIWYIYGIYMVYIYIYIYICMFIHIFVYKNFFLNQTTYCRSKTAYLYIWCIYMVYIYGICMHIYCICRYICMFIYIFVYMYVCRYLLFIIDGLMICIRKDISPVNVIVGGLQSESIFSNFCN